MYAFTVLVLFCLFLDRHVDVDNVQCCELVNVCIM